MLYFDAQSDKGGHEVGFVDSADVQMAERDLAGDALWKIMQKNTFTRWVNEHLKKHFMNITDLETDLCDGLPLIALVEVLTEHKFKHVNKRPVFRTQKLENITQVLNFLEEHEKLKLVSIDSSHIVDSNGKMILGLIWSLIIHYSISNFVLDVSETQDMMKNDATPKQRLLTWIAQVMPEPVIHNFTTDWNNGIAIGSLVNSCAPGLCPDWTDWDTTQAMKNAHEAITLADTWLSVPQLVRPEEMINPKVDEKAMMTYLSQFPVAKLKEGAPLRPKTDVSRVRAYGPGLNRTGNQIDKPCQFTVETDNAGLGKLEVILINPKGDIETCEVVSNPTEPSSYYCVYKPRTVGEYRVVIKFSGKEIPRSPFRPCVESGVDVSTIVVSGPGIETSAGNRVGRPTFFNIDTRAAGNGVLECVIVDSFQKRNSVKAQISCPEGDGVYRVEYTPKDVGVHLVHISFSGLSLLQSPYSVSVSPRESAKAAAMAALSAAINGALVTSKSSKSNGRHSTGIFNNGIHTHEIHSPTISSFNGSTECVKSMESTKCELDKINGLDLSCHSVSNSTLKSPDENPVSNNAQKDIQLISYNEIDPEKNPQTFDSDKLNDEANLSRSKSNDANPCTEAFNHQLAYATGRGVQPHGIRVQDQVKFSIHTEKCGDQAPLEVKMLRADGSTQSVSTVVVQDYLWDCSYVPKRPGKYLLHVLFGGQEIQNSPFEIVIGPYKETPIKAAGPGLRCGVVNIPNIFTVYCREQCSKINFSIKGPSEATMECLNNGDGTALVTYWVSQPGEYAVNILYDDDDIQDSPFMPVIFPEDNTIIPNNIRIFGNGVDKSVSPQYVGKITEFYVEGLVDALSSSLFRSLNDGTLSSVLCVECADNFGSSVIVNTHLRPDGSILCSYIPTTAGVHTISITVGRMNVKGSPYRVNFVEDIQLKKVKVWGPGLEHAVINQPTHFFIDPKSAVPTNFNVDSLGPISVRITDDLGHLIPVKVNKQPDGSYRVEYSPPMGTSGIHVCPMIDESSVLDTPIYVVVSTPFDVRKIKVNDLDSSYSMLSSVDGQYISQNNDGQQLLPLVPVSSTSDHLDIFTVHFQTLDINFIAPLTTDSISKEESSSAVNGLHNGIDNVSHLLHFENNLKNAEGNIGTDLSVPLLSMNGNSCAADLDFQNFSHTEITDSASPQNSVMSAVEQIDYKCSSVSVSLKQDVVSYSVHFFDEGLQSCLPKYDRDHTPPFKTDYDEQFSSVDAYFGPAFSIESERNRDMSFTRTPHTFCCTIKGSYCPDDFIHNTASPDVPVYLNCSMNQNGLSSHNNHNHDELMSLEVISDNDGIALITDGDIGIHPPRPFIMTEERLQIVSKSGWPQCQTNDVAATISATGPGLHRAVATEMTYFTINSFHAPTAPLGVTVTGPSEAKIHCIDNGDGSCAVSYNPPLPGRYILNVIYNGQMHIPGSPFVVPVYPLGKTDLKTDSIRTFGIGIQPEGVYKASYAKFNVDASSIDPFGKGVVTAILTSPSEDRLACQVINNHDGTYICNYTPLDEGVHHIELNYEGIPVAGSPFSVCVTPGSDPTKVKAFGPGLQDGNHLLAGERMEFTVDLTGAGQGGLGLAVVGPTEVPIECCDNRDGTCTVYYTPTEPGVHSVSIRFNETKIPNSPFNVTVRAKVDSSRVSCFGSGLESGVQRAGWPACFTVDTKNAGDAPLQVRYTSRPGEKMKTAQIQRLNAEVGNGQHKVTYTPEVDGVCKIEILHGGHHVPGSPFSVRILKSCEPDRVRVLGSGVEGPVLASLPATFTVDAREAGVGDLTLGLTDPKGQSLPVRVVPLSIDSESIVTNGAAPSVTSLVSGDVSDTGLLSCIYEPYMVGPHKIHVMFAGEEVIDSPFIVESIPTGRADLCVLTDDLEELIEVGKEHVITVNTAKGGKGRLTCQATHLPSATFLPVAMEDNMNGTVSVCYTPKQTGQINVELRYGGQIIPHGEFGQEILTAEQLLKRTESATHYRPVEFKITVPPEDDQFECIITAPCGTQNNVPYDRNDDSTITILCQPLEQGMHELHVNRISTIQSPGSQSNTVSMPVSGSPFRFHVDRITTGLVTAFGPGLSHGMANHPAEFTVVALEAGGGGLSISVKGPSKAEISCSENIDKTCSISYLPLAPGQYTISIKYLDQHIPGSPFTASITGDAQNYARMDVSAPSDFALEAYRDDIDTLNATVCSPLGENDTCVLKRLPNNRLGISFTPKVVGEHIIGVFQGGEHISNSPFHVMISEQEIGDPRRVRVFGTGLESGMANEPNEFTVDTRNAGYAGLNLSIEGPSKAEIKCHDNKDGTCLVTYIPTEPGRYVINVKYADSHVLDSPFHVNIGGESSTMVTERISHRLEAVSVSSVGSQCEMLLRLPDFDLNNLTASVTTPSGQRIPCQLMPTDTDHCSIKFVPQEMGEHSVTVKNNGVNIAGSPFQFTVGPMKYGLVDRVRAMGRGLLQGFTGKDNEFTVYTREAGAGTLTIAVEGPSKADIECEESENGSSNISYCVSLPGVYRISVKFNDTHIPFSPFRVDVIDTGHRDGVASHAHNFGLTRISSSSLHNHPEANKPINFSVHHRLSSGETLKAQVHSPSGLIQDALVHSKEHDQHFVQFISRETGPHLVHVHVVPLDIASRMHLHLGPGSPYSAIQGSPFRVIINHHEADPGLVHAYGDGLRRGIVGTESGFVVNTSSAGSGVLNVIVDGPSKVVLDSHEVDVGYGFSYIPTVAGVYQISIKYGGDFHIVGSPFKVDISDGRRYSSDSVSQSFNRQVKSMVTSVRKSSETHLSTDSSLIGRIHAHGLGLHGAKVRVYNNFTVDASESTPGVLLVGISGPNGPTGEVKVNHIGRDQFSVSYRVSERGKHILHVKWGNDNIPGSPFVVDVM